jgi:hypothetical protein
VSALYDATSTYAEVGPFVTGGDVERAVIDLLQEWLPAYICEGERAHGWDVGSTPTPRGWAITGRDLQKLNSDQLPCVVIMAGGITNAPKKEGGVGVWTATWGVDIGAVFNAAWGRSSREHAQLYARAICLCIEQRPFTIAGQPCQVDWRGELYDEMDFASERSYSASVCSFNVQVREAGWAVGGPPPDASPPGDPTVPFEPWVEVVEVDIATTNTPPPADLPPE